VCDREAMDPAPDERDPDIDPAQLSPHPASEPGGGWTRRLRPDGVLRAWAAGREGVRRVAATGRDRARRVAATGRDGVRGLVTASARAWHDAAQRRARRRQEREHRRQEREYRRQAQRQAEIARRQAEAARLAAQRQAQILAEQQRRAIERDRAARRHYAQLLRKERARRARRRRLAIAVLLMPLATAAGLATLGYVIDRVPLPAQLPLPETSTVYFADGVTPIARLGSVNRIILDPDEISDAVKQAIVAAEDRTFWENEGVDLRAVARAAWNNATGRDIQGASTITQQYARLAAGLTGVTYARKAREAVLAWKLTRSYSKDEILAFYLNTVPFGRGAYGIEAAADAFFGKTARRSAPVDQQVTVAEAMVLATLVKQPEPDPADPDGSPGYDPARGNIAAANSLSRWEYVRDGMVELGYLTPEEAQALTYPTTVRAVDPDADLRRLDGPTGMAVRHVLSELRQREPFRGQAFDYIGNGGFHIVTTLDPRIQAAAEAAADIRRATAPDVVRNQPETWQAALVAVEPGTGRVLAYYGGADGTGADHAGWYFDAAGEPSGFGQHPPGSSFKIYTLAEALRQGISLTSVWDSPDVKEFPASGRTYQSPTGPVRNAAAAGCQPTCTLWEATVASLNVPFFELTERLGPARVIDMARRAGIAALWTDDGQRVDLVPGADVSMFTTEVGIGQFGVTVLDHAGGVATLAAGGQRAGLHFVRKVTRDGVRVYAEQLTRTDIGLTTEQVDELTWVLSQVPSAQLDNGWDSAGKTGTWQAGTTTHNAHAWMVGYTGALAAAVWLGTTDGSPLVTRDGADVYGSTHPAAIWRQFMTEALAQTGLDPARYRFRPPATIPPPASPA
jgi:Membrane carboxypeptidase (penicillin-binding protein)